MDQLTVTDLMNCHQPAPQGCRLNIPHRNIHTRVK